ncbi:MAG: DNA circularization N-terminal domain-containing protein [Myxococcales bacterium]|jgi:prophage DNA circulation protein|nr:DNA circularization N-terminal domain-containing protein [Myxococcales bacterium]
MADLMLKGSFRYVPFQVRQHSLEGGRRVVVHELPQRDEGLVEDLGRKQRTFSVEMFGVGPGLFGWRDDLIRALETPGPGLLVHPYLGELQVMVVAYKADETIAELGMARASVTFAEATSELRVVEAQDTAGQVRETAIAAQAELAQNFVESAAGEDLVSPLAQLGADIEGILDRVSSVQEAVGERIAAVSQFIGQAQELARLPLQAAQATLSLIEGTCAILAGLTAPLGRSDSGARVTTVARAAQSIGSNIPEIGGLFAPAPTAEAVRRAQDQKAVALLAKGAFAASLATASLDAGFQDSRTALEAGIQIDRLAEAVIANPAAGLSLREAVSELRAATEEHLRGVVADLPRRSKFTPAATIPAILVSQRLYGTPNRAQEIVRLNSIADPLSVPGDRELEVLSDA